MGKAEGARPTFDGRPTEVNEEKSVKWDEFNPAWLMKMVR